MVATITDPKTLFIPPRYHPARRVGHHTQFSYARKDLNPLRAVLWNASMVEGWAVYGEGLIIVFGAVADLALVLAMRASRANVHLVHERAMHTHTFA